MRHVRVERHMIGVDPDLVWKIACDLLEFPRVMSNVVSVEDVSNQQNLSETSWVVLFNGNEMSWIEANKFDHQAKRYTFSQIEGDLADWRGSFELEESESALLARYDVFFDLGIPALADTLEPLGEVAVRANCEQMLRAMEAQASYAQVNPTVR